jgi:hypothetical protein
MGVYIGDRVKEMAMEDNIVTIMIVIIIQESVKDVYHINDDSIIVVYNSDFEKLVLQRSDRVNDEKGLICDGI